MVSSDQGSLTEFLLDLSESKDLYDDFMGRPEDIIKERRLERYHDILVPPYDVRALRNAVRAEVTGESRGEDPSSGGDESIIMGIRGIRVPEPPGPPPPP